MANDERLVREMLDERRLASTGDAHHSNDRVIRPVVYLERRAC